MMTVNEISKISGLSVRTLHYYDEIGLFRPNFVNDAGYRLYDESCLAKLKDIMLLKELEFSLNQIKRIVDSPEFDRKKALKDQIEILELKRARLDNLIDFANDLMLKGDSKMGFEVFDKTKIEAYQKLAEKTWGETKEYKEFKEKDSKLTDIEKRQNAEDMMNIFFEFGEMKNLSPESETVQTQVKKLQDFITANYYTCSKQILKSLGQMYVAGGEMTTNIDVAGGKGCAEFVQKAIEIYCK